MQVRNTQATNQAWGTYRLLIHLLVLSVTPSKVQRYSADNGMDNLAMK